MDAPRPLAGTCRLAQGASSVSIDRRGWLGNAFDMPPTAHRVRRTPAQNRHSRGLVCTAFKLLLTSGEDAARAFAFEHDLVVHERFLTELATRTGDVILRFDGLLLWWLLGITWDWPVHAHVAIRLVMGDSSFTIFRPWHVTSLQRKQLPQLQPRRQRHDLVQMPRLQLCRRILQHHLWHRLLRWRFVPSTLDSWTGARSLGTSHAA